MSIVFPYYATDLRIASHGRSMSPVRCRKQDSSTPYIHTDQRGRVRTNHYPVSSLIWHTYPYASPKACRPKTNETVVKTLPSQPHKAILHTKYLTKKIPSQRTFIFNPPPLISNPFLLSPISSPKNILHHISSSQAKFSSQYLPYSFIFFRTNSY